MSRPLIEIRSLTKRFPGVTALQGVSFSVAAGSCHGLVGENGAGKSTLAKILAGQYRADEGEVWLDGRAVEFAAPRDALAAGIGIVHQELAFCENLSVAENLNLGRLPRRGPFVSRQQMLTRARQWLSEVGAEVDADEPMGALSVARQQLVQIAGAISRGARVLIFDEPTSSLSQVEAERLFALIRRLRQQGVTCLYVSHRLGEIFSLCDSVTVLRDGRHVATRPRRDWDEDSLVQAMIGRSVAAYFPVHLQGRGGEELLRVENLSSPGRFSAVSFCLRAGEVLGMAGLVGAGRTEVARALFGLDPRASGKVFVRGRPVRFRSPRQAMDAGLGLVPEDRKRQGLVLPMNVRENLSLPSLERLACGGWVRRRRERALAERWVRRLQVRTPHLDATVAGLSGGNQQKIVLAKWLAADCQVLIVDEPTRGVDVGAKAEIHALLDELANQGRAVLLISSELPELINLCSRVLVMRAGRIVGELPREEMTQERLLRLMAGVTG